MALFIRLNKFLNLINKNLKFSLNFTIQIRHRSAAATVNGSQPAGWPLGRSAR